MLCLSRKNNESIMIGQNIRVVVIDMRGRTVRLGIEAPPEVQVHRLEVFQAIEREGAKPTLLDRIIAGYHDLSDQQRGALLTCFPEAA